MKREQLKKWREDRNVSQPELAELLGVHVMTVWAWEHGRQKLTPYLHLALAELSRRLEAEEPPETPRPTLRRVK